jgi:hypothetical protein
VKSKRFFILYPRAIRLRLSLVGAFLVVCMAGCSSLSIESARSLGTTGQETSAQNTAAIFASDDGYQRAMDADAFFHGFAGMSVPQQLSTNYESIQAELRARKIVFSKLGDVYEAFSGLAAIDAATGIETAINGLGDAVNGYADALKKSPVISSSAQGVIAGIGGLIAAEIQKKKIKQSSMLIRERLTEFAKLFTDPLVRTQMITFKQNLAQNRSSAIELLWKKGVFDPNPLIDQMGADAGLKASKEAIKIVNDPKETSVRGGLEEVIVARLNRKINLIEKGYHASVQAVEELIVKHEKLEEGEELNLTRLRQIIAELQRITELLIPKESSSKEK